MAVKYGKFRLFPRRRTGFLTRLGNIIIIQVLFVFAALAIVFFFPESRSTVDSEYLFMRERLRQVGANITALFDEYEAWGTDEITDPDMWDRLAGLIEIDNVEQFYLIRQDDEGRVKTLFSLVDDNRSVDESSGEVHWASLIDKRFLSRSTGLSEDQLIPIVHGSRYFVYYYKIQLSDSSPLILAAISDHEQPTGAELRYAFLLLFLVAALVSFLTVYLINRRFQRPLDRLIRGFDRTVKGELYCLVEADMDDELSKLTSAYNNMSMTMWENHKQLSDYNERLENSNEMLRESQEFLGTLIDSSPICIVSTNAEGVIVIFNREASRVFGVERKEAVGRQFDDLFTHRLSEIKTSKAIISDNHSMEVLCRRGDGTLFPAYLISVPVDSRDGEVWAYLHLIKDISESKNFQEMMIRLDRYYTRGEMAGDIAHEINNFLAILSGNIELMPILLKNGDREKIDKKLGVMRSQVDRITHFTDGLLDSGEGEVKFETADINQLVETVVAFLKPQNKFDRIEIRTEPTTEIPLVDVDTGQMQQLLVNLLRNASEAVEGQKTPGQVIIRTALTPREGPPIIRVEVQDNGPGVREDKVELLFNRRFTTKPRGHGIGLITCKRIIETHGGNIGYRFDGGARFYFEIPVKKRSSAKDSTEEPEAAVSRPETEAAPSASETAAPAQ